MLARNLTRKDYHLHENRAGRLREALVNRMKRIKTKRVAVLLSSGVDSHTGLFAALAAGKSVTCYTFGRQDRNSKDVRIAADTADRFSLPWTFVPLDPDVNKLKRYLLRLYEESPYHISKASAECLWPMFETFKHIDETVIVNGLGGDVFFATVRSWKKIVESGGVPAYEKMKNDYLKVMTGKVGDVQLALQRRWLKKNKSKPVEIVCSFEDPLIFKCFEGMHPIAEGCKPIQKAPLRLAFYDEFKKTQVKVHQSYNKGDSGISDAFEALLKTDWNYKGFKSVVGIYNALETGVITTMKFRSET